MVESRQCHSFVYVVLYLTSIPLIDLSLWLRMARWISMATVSTRYTQISVLALLLLITIANLEETQ
ncbi:hypothetical protein BT96DRAFT_189278 [Gymnopus androsaceus JB14]|uniref:Uncharacterized protein n=1 Tax=Gymnopus androsaceus JB14 TaxID=1447944 RepID=A0A6A4HAN6_9AGAR|nr:hypothetical protein BT96DRAFT_189278 [Gymnopus androsaceus JB14]